MLAAGGVFVVLQAHLSLAPSLSLLMSRSDIMVCACQRPYEKSEPSLWNDLSVILTVEANGNLVEPAAVSVCAALWLTESPPLLPELWRHCTTVIIYQKSGYSGAEPRLIQIMWLNIPAGFLADVTFSLSNPRGSQWGGRVITRHPVQVGPESDASWSCQPAWASLQHCCHYIFI